MSDLVLRLARPGEDARIADFINQNFDMRLPLINRADFYQFYYAHTPGAAPQFALAEQDGEILCAAGTFWPTRAKRRTSGFRSGLPQRAITVWGWS